MMFKCSRLGEYYDSVFIQPFCTIFVDIPEGERKSTINETQSQVCIVLAMYCFVARKSSLVVYMIVVIQLYIQQRL